MDKIAIVTSKFGKDINGGQELHVALLVQHLQKIYDITILSTCLNDKSESFYPVGENKEDGHTIIRFATEKPNKKLHDKAGFQVFV